MGAVEAPIVGDDALFIGDRRTIRFRITSPLTIQSAVWAAGVATLQTATAHGAIPGRKVGVAGMVPNGYNGSYLVQTVPNPTTLTVLIPVDPGAAVALGTLDSGSPANISSWSLEWTLRERASAPGVLLEKDSGTPAQITITDGANGIAEVYLVPADTLPLKSGRFFHTLRRSNVGSESVLSFGDVDLRYAATR